MAFPRRWLLILFALILGGGPLSAASTKEQRAYAAAVADFQTETWSRAETEFAQFVGKYPESTNAPQAVLLRAQAEFKQGELTNAIALLTDTNNLAKSGTLAAEYFYWTGEAQFQGLNYSGAAETWIALSQKFRGSPLRLRAVVGAAAAFAKLENRPQIIALLEETNGVFQRAAQSDPENEQVERGELLLAQAKFGLKDFAGASAILEPLPGLPALKPELGWQCAQLLYQVKIAAGDPGAALAATTNLFQIAAGENNGDWRAESLSSRAAALEKLGRADEAIAAYRQNLTNTAPVENQQQAVLKIAELSIAQRQFLGAETNLQNFLAQFPDSPSAAIALLTLGELQLKDYAAQSSPTNLLQQAQANFDKFLGTFTNSATAGLAGKAHLDRGWCEWLAKGATNGLTESLTDFEAAAQSTNLPPEDLAVARFKMGDAMFALANYAGALTNYRAVLDGFPDFPAVTGALGDRALYQSLRASLQLTNYDGASNALAQILKQYPASDLATNSALLYGEGLAEGRPAAAREQFQNFETQFPGTPLRPRVEFAIARTYALESNWPAAIAGYQGWLKDFPTNDLQQQVDYSLAWANYQAGNMTNAFGLFANFVAQFPDSEMAPKAQWWVADYFFNEADYVGAEKNYELFYLNFPTNHFAGQARLMAGRAAVARQDYSHAISDYFNKLEGDTNWPIDLRVQATFEHGFALMRSDSTDTNNPLANFGPAITNEFGQIVQLDPTNENGALAWFYIGECEFQLANYDAATNAYAQVLNTNMQADISLRSHAQIGIGIALEKMAALPAGTNQAALLELALSNYMDVFHEKNVRDDEVADAFWVEKAGLQAAAVAETLGNWNQAADFYLELKRWLPQLGDSLDRKIAGAEAHASQKIN